MSTSKKLKKLALYIVLLLSPGALGVTAYHCTCAMMEGTKPAYCGDCMCSSGSWCCCEGRCQPHCRCVKCKCKKGDSPRIEANTSARVKPHKPCPAPYCPYPYCPYPYSPHYPYPIYPIYPVNPYYPRGA